MRWLCAGFAAVLQGMRKDGAVRDEGVRIFTAGAAAFWAWTYTRDAREYLRNQTWNGTRMNPAALDPIDGQVLTMLRRPGRGITPAEIARELCITTKFAAACVRRLRAAGYEIWIKRLRETELIVTEPSGWPRILADGLEFYESAEAA